jgi:LemA protein
MGGVMGTWLIVSLVLVVLLLVLPVIWGIGVYNALVAISVGVKEAWAQIDTVLQRRFDLIPNLVETVKGYAAHEKETFTRVTEARARATAPGPMADKVKAANEFESALARLLVTVENYPQLKADQNFRMLQEELTSTEDRIAGMRAMYNEAVRRNNTAVRLFPNNIVAGIFRFGEEAYFEVGSEAKQAPKVKFT